MIQQTLILSPLPLQYQSILEQYGPYSFLMQKNRIQKKLSNIFSTSLLNNFLRKSEIYKIRRMDKRNNDIFKVIWNQILRERVMVELQYQLINENSNQMEGFNIPHNYITHPLAYSFCDPALYYYQYYHQTSLQNLNYTYNQYCSYLYQRNQNYEPNHMVSFPLKSNSPTSSNDHEILKQKINHRQTRSKVNKTLEVINRIDKNSYNHQGKQKENRNVYSNILRSFFRRISQDGKAEQIVERIISKRGLSLAANDFFEYLKRLKINYGRYLRFKKLRQLFINQKFKEHSIIFRILFEHFKNGDFLTHTLTSRKIGKWSIILHIKGGRQLKQRLLN